MSLSLWRTVKDPLVHQLLNANKVSIVLSLLK